jgi:hypothetical protein
LTVFGAKSSFWVNFEFMTLKTIGFYDFNKVSITFLPTSSLFFALKPTVSYSTFLGVWEIMKLVFPNFGTINFLCYAHYVLILLDIVSSVPAIYELSSSN